VPNDVLVFGRDATRRRWRVPWRPLRLATGVLLILVLAILIYLRDRRAGDPVEYAGSYRVTYLPGSSPRIATLFEQVGAETAPVPGRRYHVVTIDWTPTGTARVGAGCRWSAFVLHSDEWNWTGHAPSDWSDRGSAAAAEALTSFLDVQAPSEDAGGGTMFSLPASLDIPLTVVYSVQPPRVHPQLRVALVVTCGEEPIAAKWLTRTASPAP
jgi:hypothetical protein